MLTRSDNTMPPIRAIHDEFSTLVPEHVVDLEKSGLTLENDTFEVNRLIIIVT